MAAVNFFTMIALLLELGLLDILFPQDRRKRVHSCWVRPWILRRGACDTAYTLLRELQAIDDTQEFRRMVRMDEATYTDLLNRVTPLIQRQDTVMRECICPAIRLAVTMRFLAFGISYPPLSHDFRLGVTTVMNIIRDTCMAIWTVLKPEYMRTPKTRHQWLEVARGFQVKWQFPHCIGAIDGKHFRVRKPRNSGSAFYNYKGYYSVQILAVVDANYRFIYADIGGEGRLSDGGQWGKSRLRRKLEHGTINLPAPANLPESDAQAPYVLVGDDAFQLATFMMKPYSRRDLDLDERVFNYRLSRARRCSENAFGILASRFRLFLGDINAEPDNAVTFIKAGMVLHNYLREKCGQAYLHPGAVDAEDANNRVQPGAWRQVVHDRRHALPPTRNRNATAEAKEVRVTYRDYFNSAAGSVPWQLRAVDCNFVDPHA